MSTNAHGGAFEGRNRRVLAQQGLRADAADAAATGLAGRVDGLEGRVQALEDAPPVTTGNLVRTVLTLTVADVVALGAVLSGTVDLAPTLPVGSHIVNALTRVVTPFVSGTTPYDLNGQIDWVAFDSVAPDAIPFVATGKGSFLIGSDTAPVPTYGSFGATGPNADPFGAGSPNDFRWAYTPTVRVNLSSTGPNLDTYTAGELEIIVLSVTML